MTRQGQKLLHVLMIQSVILLKRHLNNLNVHLTVKHLNTDLV